MTSDSSAEATLTIEIKNNEPVDLMDLAASFEALAAQYKGFAKRHGHSVGNEDVRLYVREIKSGSIIAELASLAMQGSIVLNHLEALKDFSSHLLSIIEFFLNKNKTPPDANKVELSRVSTMLEVAARDPGSQFNTSVKHGNVVINNINITSNDARAIQNGIGRLIAKKPDELPEDGDKFTDQAMTIWQARNDPKSKVGDKGHIDQFSDKPLKLLFSSDEVKKAVLDRDENIFHQVFMVSGRVIVADDRPVAYKIYDVSDVFEQPD